MEPMEACQQRYRWHLEKNATQMIASDIVADYPVAGAEVGVLNERVVGVHRDVVVACPQRHRWNVWTTQPSFQR